MKYIIFLIELYLLIYIVKNVMIKNDKYDNFPNFSSLELEFYATSDEYITKYNPIGLGDGFPDYLPPKHLLRDIEVVAHNKSWQLHQYSPSRGEPRLLNALAKFYSIIMNRNINPNSEVLVTGGATQSLSFAFQAFLTPGSEIILFEPFYASYIFMIDVVGAVPVYVPLRPINCTKPYTSNDFTFDKDELESKFNSKTRMLLVNTPNNPLGKTFTWEELKFIAHLCIKYNVLVLSDQTAEFYTFDGTFNNKIATLPNMWERTITVISGGKTFSNTGWRIGWAIGPANRINQMMILLGGNIISLSALLQIPFAMGIETEIERYNTQKSYFVWHRDEVKRKRDQVFEILETLEIQTILPNAGLYIIADFKHLMNKIDLSNIADDRPGFKLVLWLIQEKKLILNPLSIYVSEKNRRYVENMTRIAFIKTEDTINKFKEIMFSIANIKM